MRTQHPLVRRFVANAQRQGAAVYAGASFAIAHWENGKRVEIRVDHASKQKLSNRSRYG